MAQDRPTARTLMHGETSHLRTTNNRFKTNPPPPKKKKKKGIVLSEKTNININFASRGNKKLIIERKILTQRNMGIKT